VNVNQPPGRLRFDHEHVTTYDELVEQGKAARGQMPRKRHGDYTPRTDRDPVGLVREQNEQREADLVPLRMERLLRDPFSFFRGTAAQQAFDLAPEQTTGANVTISGDAHLGNFGLYASPHRSIVFDLNDFDEAAYGPWEWDIKRFVTSVVIAARLKKFNDDRTETAALRGAAAYRIGLRQMFELDALERYYVRAEVKKNDERFHPTSQKVIDQALKQAKKRNAHRALAKITERADDGSAVIVENPPILTHVTVRDEKLVAGLLEQYRSSVTADIATLLSQYTVTDIVRRVVGVGSVGTRCFLVVLTGTRGEPLILQVKQAAASALQTHGQAAGALPPELVDRPEQHGYRVVANQRILQAVSDPFLGYLDSGDDAYYVRQFRDGNVSFDTENLEPRAFLDYVDACGTSLARAHAQSAQAAFVAGYLGAKTNFDNAVVQWATSYADQSLADYKAVRKAAGQKGTL